MRNMRLPNINIKAPKAKQPAAAAASKQPAGALMKDIIRDSRFREESVWWIELREISLLGAWERD